MHPMDPHPSPSAATVAALDRPPAVPAVPVLGIPLALTDYERTLDWIDAAAESGHRGYVCVAATHTVMACQEDAELRDAVLGADFTVPDGQPLVWALNALGAELGDRVYGPDLMERACERAVRTGRRFYLYGGRNQGAAGGVTPTPRLPYPPLRPGGGPPPPAGRTEGARVEPPRPLRPQPPGRRIGGGPAPPFRALTAAEEDAIVADINRAAPDVVWVGIGVPKQEKWMARLRERLDAPVLVGVGAAFDFHAGLIPQAPAWMQRAGLEWMFRLAQEPRRLWRRSLRSNPRFVTGFARQYVAHLRRR